MNGLTARIQAWWQTMNPTSRMIALVGGVGLLVLLVSVGFWASTPDWAVLYSGLAPSDAGAIVDRLKTQKVPYRLSNDSTTIEVPSKNRDDMRITLAKDNLPSQSALGYYRMEKMPFGQTQDMQKQEIRVMLEEELQKTIQHLGPVDSARVIINQGSDSPFADNEKQASAMVVVHTKTGQQLTGEQVQGLVFIVCRSVPGISESTVAVVDGDGRPLWDGSQAKEGGMGIASTKHDAEVNYAAELQSQIRQHLDTVFGAGKSTVWVRAELNFDQMSEHREEGIAGPKTSEAEEQETMQKGGATPAGVIGAIPPASVGGITTTSSTTEGGGYVRTAKTSSRATGHIIRETKSALGKVDQLSVAVFLDESITPEATAELKLWLDTAVGADLPQNTAREVNIQRVKFSTSANTANAAALQVASSARRMEQMMQLLPIVALIFVGGLIVKALSKAAWRTAPMNAALSSGHNHALSSAYGSYGRTPRGDGQEADEGYPEQEGISEETPVERIHVKPIQLKTDPALEQINRLAKDKPEQVALLIKGWMSEDSK